MKKIAVIGAGIGGITAAMKLAHEGYEIDVYEKGSQAGGKAGNMIIDGFRFDTGPSLFTMPFVFEKLFRDVDEKFSEYVFYSAADVICNYFYQDGLRLHAYSDIRQFMSEMINKTGESQNNIRAYFNRIREIYDLVKDPFLFGNPWDLKSISKQGILKGLKTLFRVDPFHTFDKFNRSFFNDDRIVQLFDRYATYTGSDPYQAPATLSVIPWVEYAFGAHYPRDGIYAIIESMKRVAEKKGARFYFNSEVDTIVTEKKKVIGIHTKGEFRRYDIIVSNADVRYTYDNLLESNSKQARRYRKFEPSLSGIVFYWGMDRKYSNLGTDNIFFSREYKKEFQHIFKNHTIAEDQTIYINITSKYNKTDAPQGGENWFVLINAPSENGQDWDVIKKRVRKQVIYKLEQVLKKPVEKHIVAESSKTPLTILKETHSNFGSIYGVSSNHKMSAFYRQQARSKDYSGLYFCGGSAHPGGGMPLVVLSGMNAAEEIVQQENNND